MQIDWPLTIAVLLILLKQLFKLFLNHKPDRVDYLKAAAILPVDVSFLIVSLFVKAAMQPASSPEILIGLMVIYIIVSFFTTVLWRVSDNAITNELGGHFFWAFPLNAALSGTTFFIAIQLVR